MTVSIAHYARAVAGLLGGIDAMQCAEQILRRRGFRKTHFAHFARAEDAKHTVRGEDLVADSRTASRRLVTPLSPRPPRRFIARHAELPRAPLDAYLMLQCAEQLLRRRGFRKTHFTHFTHFARAEDANLYYGHTVRGEDLVALGASADGVIGSYHYRHAMLDDYVARAAIDLGLEGGVDESPRERALRNVENALMAADFEQHAVPAACLDDWRGRALVAGDGRLTLTANGSWLMTSMLAQLYDVTRACVSPH